MKGHLCLQNQVGKKSKIKSTTDKEKEQNNDASSRQPWGVGPTTWCAGRWGSVGWWKKKLGEKPVVVIFVLLFLFSCCCLLLVVGCWLSCCSLSCCSLSCCSLLFLDNKKDKTFCTPIREKTTTPLGHAIVDTLPNVKGQNTSVFSATPSRPAQDLTTTE